MEGTELIRVAQLPIIEERLREVKEQWERVAAENAALVCTEDTVQAVKSARAEMTKQYNELEALRKAVKGEYMKAYDAFEATYRDCITGPYKAADAALKQKIDSTEAEIKARCEERLRTYFAELCQVHGLPWLKYEQAGVRIDMTFAKQKTPRKLMDALSDFTARVAVDVEAIDAGPDAADVMAEYKANGLNLARAQKAVADRREAAEAEKRAAAEREERRKRDAEAVKKVQAAIPVVPPPTAAPPIQAPPHPPFSFRLFFDRPGQWEAVLPVLRELKKVIQREGIRYE